MRTHSCTTRVRYGETDPMGVVYHAHHFQYFEMGRTELLRAAGVAYRDLEARGFTLVVTEASCRYRAHARYDEVLHIHTRVSRVGKASVGFEYALHGPDGRPVAEGHTDLACLDAHGKPARLPADVAALLGGPDPT